MVRADVPLESGNAATASPNLHRDLLPLRKRGGVRALLLDVLGRDHFFMIDRLRAKGAFHEASSIVAQDGLNGKSIDSGGFVGRRCESGDRVPRPTIVPLVPDDADYLHFDLVARPNRALCDGRELAPATVDVNRPENRGAPICPSCWRLAEVLRRGFPA